MARTPTTQIPLGFKAPNFNLPDVVSNKNISLLDIEKSKGFVIMFICNHCPYVVHVIDEIVNIADKYQKMGIGFVAINSNDVINYPDDDPEKMEIFAKDKKFSFPYLFDQTQDVARAYDAACTPDFSVFDSNSLCTYRGQMDGARPKNNEPNNGEDLRKVLDYLIEGKEIDFEQKPSLGCNIKWK